MTAFEDASAIVARYTPEFGRRPIDHDGPIVVSDMSRVEVTSAIWRKQRMGELSPDQARVLVDTFLAEMSAASDPATANAATYLPVAVRTEVLDSGVELCGRHGLRAYDAVQLACAVRARAIDPSITEFVTYDVGLHRAAAAEGFRVNPLAP